MGRETIKEKIEILISYGDISTIKENPPNPTEEEKRLSYIKTYVKRRYKEGKLTESQIKSLEEHGMVWQEKPKKEGIRNNVKILVEHGNIGNIPIYGKNLTDKERKLGEIKHSVKRAYRMGSLTNEEIEILEKNGMVWDEKNLRGRKLEEAKRRKEKSKDKLSKANRLLEQCKRLNKKEDKEKE